MTTAQWDPTNPHHTSEESVCFLKGLRLGDKLKILHSGFMEEMSLVREVYKDSPKRPRVVVRRPHLKMPVVISEKEGWLLVRFSAKLGNEYLDWSAWTIEREGVDIPALDLPRPSPTPPPTPRIYDFGATPTFPGKRRGRPRRAPPALSLDSDSTLPLSTEVSESPQ